MKQPEFMNLATLPAHTAYGFLYVVVTRWRQLQQLTLNIRGNQYLVPDQRGFLHRANDFPTIQVLARRQFFIHHERPDLCTIQ